MLTECKQDSCEFASLGSRKVTAAFDGGAITSNAGALLLREADGRTGLPPPVRPLYRQSYEKCGLVQLKHTRSN